MSMNVPQPASVPVMLMAPAWHSWSALYEQPSTAQSWTGGSSLTVMVASGGGGPAFDGTTGPRGEGRLRTRVVSIQRLSALVATRPPGAVEWRRTSGELLEDQLADAAGVGLAAHLLHDEADQR